MTTIEPTFKLADQDSRAARGVGFADGERHGWIADFCDLLEARILGRHAEALLASGQLPREAAVITLPVWRWAKPGTNVGAKARARDGGTLLLPIRVSWAPAPLLVLPPGEQVRVAWKAAGLGHTGHGQTLACALGRSAGQRLAEDPSSGLPSETGSPVLGRAALRTELRRLAERGRDAQWALYAKLESFAMRAVQRAHGRVASEMAGDSVRPDGFAVPVLSQTDLEMVASRMTLSDDPARESAVIRLVECCMRETTFTKVDPLHYVTVALDRDAEAEVRRAIGDPHIGPKIRKLARSLHRDATVSEVLAACQRQWPSQRIGQARVQAALTNRSAVDERFAPSLHEIDHETPNARLFGEIAVASAEEEAVRRIDRERASTVGACGGRNDGISGVPGTSNRLRIRASA